MNIEPLESRIAPASVFTYTDVDGDNVKITASASRPRHLARSSPSSPQAIGNLRGGLNLDAAPSPAPTHVHRDKSPAAMGWPMSATSTRRRSDLGTSPIKGDLARIDCGDGNRARPAIKTLTVRSMGRFGSRQGGFAGLESDIQGKLSALVVAGDVKDVFFHSTVGIGAVTIKGSLIGRARFVPAKLRPTAASVR